MSAQKRSPFKAIASAVLVAIITLGGYIAWTHADSSPIKIHHVTINPTVIGMKATGAFMMMENTSEKDISLVGAESDISPNLELHEHVMKDGLMSMQKVEEIVIPAGGSTLLEPGSYHLMIMNLKHAVRKGSKVDLQLNFSDGSTVSVKADAKRATSNHHHAHKSGY